VTNTTNNDTFIISKDNTTIKEKSKKDDNFQNQEKDSTVLV